MPGISFIIINYYTSHLVENLVSSIREVDSDNITEIIIVDNTTDDEASYRSQLESVRVHYTGENLGFARACNIGAKLAANNNLVFINSDSLVWQPGFVELLIKSFNELPEKTIFTGRILNEHRRPVCNTFKFSTFIHVYFQNSINRVWGAGIPFISNKVRAYLKDKSCEVDWISGAFLCIKKNYFFELGGFDENLFMYEEDAELCYRAKQSNGKVVFIPDINIIHYSGQSSKNNSELLALIGLRSALYFYKKRTNRFKAFLLEKLILLSWNFIYYLFVILSLIFPSPFLKKKIFWAKLVNISRENLVRTNLLTYNAI